MRETLFEKLLETVRVIDDIKTKINFIKFNDDGLVPECKFETLEEFQKYEKQLLSGELDFLLADKQKDKNENNSMIDTFYEEKQDYVFFVFTYKSDVDKEYCTYLNIEYKTDIINFLYGKSDNSKEEALNTLNTLKTIITNNSIDYILNFLIDDTIKRKSILERELQILTSK